MRYLTAIALVVTFFALSCAGEGTKTYRNEGPGYELRYPASWPADLLPCRRCSGVRVQAEYVPLSGPDSQGAPSVVIAANQPAL